MIYGVFGLPGSGKSYYVVKEFILDRIVKGTVVSNIKLADNYHLDNYIYLEKHDVDNFHKNIKSIIERDNLSHDDKKILLNNLLSIYTSDKGDLTIIIDEAHLYGYRGRSTSISWADDFLSIHRHIFTDNAVDIVLITQVPSRLNSEISGQIEVSIQAVPSSQRIIKSMLEYGIYGSVKGMISRDSTMRMSRKILKGDKSVFEVYQSGFVQEGSSGFRKKIGLILAGLVVVGIFTYSRFSALFSKSEVLENSNDISTVSPGVKINNDVNKTIDSVSREYDVYCQSMPLNFDYKKNIKDFFFVINGDTFNNICFKKYIKVS